MCTFQYNVYLSIKLVPFNTTGTFPNTYVPEVGFSWSAMRFSSVDFPAPFGPTMPMRSPVDETPRRDMRHIMWPIYKALHCLMLVPLGPTLPQRSPVDEPPKRKMQRIM